ncbi:TetR/AcrR family transcriptional regulator [Streptomyces litchfieldiae]|uniref:Helix-turn-helix domain-containing protein n=1 Tax=Streptomyces litchfieldiae TaxID=3075543 RepID=A0ABU2MTM4_9ACTN|nr:helix-turn-helix domain-containing protein [Streptomyces sp. DSM 44938]MDT0344990.1 helix-turn-helix domain-containing protein [Streptomyces sp. DSM 44938]
MSRKPVLRDHIATSVLAAAAVVLAERGDAASMADIASAAGVGRATLYRYFPTREALLAALGRRALDELTDRIEEAGLETVPVAEGIARLTRAFLGTGCRYAAFLRTGPKPADADEIQAQLGAPLLALLARGAADGTLRADLSPEVLLAFYGGLIESAMPLAAPGALGVERASAATTAFFLNGAVA